MLTQRQLDVLNLLAEGLEPEEMAARLGILRHTLLYHRKKLYLRLRVNNTAQMLGAAKRLGLLKTDRQASTAAAD